MDNSDMKRTVGINMQINLNNYQSLLNISV